MQKLAEIIQKIHEKPRVRAAFFFLFYVLFVLLVLSLLRFSNNSSETPMDHSFPFSIAMFENPNYHFSYRVSMGSLSYDYVGDRLFEQEKFSYFGKDYFYDGVMYYVDNTEVDNPYVLEDFKDPRIVLSLLREAYFEAKTVYESGKVSYRYLLDSNTIYGVIENIVTDYEGESNVVMVSVDEDGNIDKIVFQLDDYCGKSTTCEGTLKIEETYEKWGEIQSLLG